MFFRRRRSANSELTTGAYELTPRGRHTRLLLVVLTIIIVAALSVGGVRYFLEHFASGSEISSLRRENAELRSALEKARFEFELERATRSELERQLAGLTEKLHQTEEELAFVKAAMLKPAR
jgi:septal ring factor EnvC (AmiA/AmiB activator)